MIYPSLTLSLSSFSLSSHCDLSFLLCSFSFLLCFLSFFSLYISYLLFLFFRSLLYIPRSALSLSAFSLLPFLPRFCLSLLHVLFISILTTFLFLLTPSLTLSTFPDLRRHHIKKSPPPFECGGFDLTSRESFWATSLNTFYNSIKHHQVMANSAFLPVIIDIHFTDWILQNPRKINGSFYYFWSNQNWNQKAGNFLNMTDYRQIFLKVITNYS